MASATINLTGTLPILLRRKWTILLSGFVTACLVVSIAKIMPTAYVSAGGLIVENSEPNDPDLGLGVGAPNQNNDGVVLTQLEVLRSRGVIDHVVHELDLPHAASLKPTLNLPAFITGYIRAAEASLGLTKQDPMEQAVDYVQKHLKVEATEHSSVISVQFEAGSPELASAVITGLMDTYLASDIASRQIQISKVSKWLAERTAALREEADAAEQQVQMFVLTHNVSDVQGSTATALQLSKDQGQLALARQELARQQAALDTVLRGGGAVAQETLGSKTIALYREREAGIMQQIARLSPTDDRRVGLQQELNSIRGQIDNETNKIVSSIKRDNEIARTSVHALEMTVVNGAMQAHTASVDLAALMKLRNTADAKRQMYISFGTRSEQTQLASAQLPSARILFPASTVPRHPMTVLAALCGFIGGIIVSISIIILRETMGTKIDSTAKVAMAIGLPTFGCLPEVRKSGKRDILAPAKTAALVTETLRAMWLTMQSQAREGEGAMVVVTSSEIGEGKTTVAAALARKTAADGYRVLLIDADLRRPRLAAAMNLRPEKTLEAVLNGSATLNEAVLRDPQFGVHCLLSQGNVANAMRVLASDRFKALLAESKAAYDFVVLDSPPVLRVADAVMLAKLCRHILFIVGSGRVPGELVIEAVQRFSEEDRGKIIPLLTRVRPSEMNPRDYFGGYGVSHASL